MVPLLDVRLAGVMILPDAGNFDSRFTAARCVAGFFFWFNSAAYAGANSSILFLLLGLSILILFWLARKYVAIRIKAEKHGALYEAIVASSDNVKYNGVGLAWLTPALLGIFQRLHSSKKFEGTGICLAIVQRIDIVECLGV